MLDKWIEIISDWPDLVALVSEKGHVVSCSKAFSDWTGWSVYKLSGKHVHDELCAPARSFAHEREQCPLVAALPNAEALPTSGESKSEKRRIFASPRCIYVLRGAPRSRKPKQAHFPLHWLAWQAILVYRSACWRSSPQQPPRRTARPCACLFSRYSTQRPTNGTPASLSGCTQARESRLVWRLG